MKNITKTILLFLFTVEIIAQISSRVGLNSNVVFIPQGFTFATLSGYGNSCLYNDVSNLGPINPAALEIFNKMEIGFSYQFETKITESWIADIGSNRINNFIPQSMGFVYPYNNLRFGIAMNQKYNRELIFGKIPITTMENPDGTGEYFEAKNRTKIYNYSFLTSYNVKNIFANSDLSFGCRIGFSQLHLYSKLYLSETDEYLYQNDIAVGATLKYNLEKKQYIKFGMMYEFEQNFNKTVKYESDENQIFDPDKNQFYFPITNYIFVANLPSSLRFDFDISTARNLKILGGISNIFWSLINDNNKDQIEMFGNIVYKINETFTPSIGFIFTDRNYKEDYFGLNQNLNAIYFTAGSVINYSNYKIHFVFADSHLFSGKWRKQSIFKISLNYEI